MSVITLQRVGKRSQIKERILGLIEKEKLRPGDQILSQKQLAQCFGVAPLTIHRCLKELTNEKHLYRVNGKGTFVGPRPVRAKRIALILPSQRLETPEGNPKCWFFVQHICHEIMTCLDELDTFTTVVVPPDSDDLDYQQFAAYDAVLTINPELYRSFMKRLVRKEITQLVVIGYDDEEIPYLSLAHDLTLGTKMGITHLFNAGYRQVAVFHTGHPWGQCFADGYRQACEDFQRPFCADNVFSGFDDAECGVRAATILLDRGLPFDAVMAYDHVAVRMVHTLRERGVRIPEDLGVMGYHGLNWALQQPPFLTSVKVPYRKMVKHALQMIEARRGEQGFIDEHIIFQNEIIGGKTCR